MRFRTQLQYIGLLVADLKQYMPVRNFCYVCYDVFVEHPCKLQCVIILTFILFNCSLSCILFIYSSYYFELAFI